jgi:hypothetical protein
MTVMQRGQPAEVGRHALLLLLSSFRVHRNITTCLIMPRRYAAWSKAGQLDWWVKNGRNDGVAYAVRTAVNGGSELLIFVPSVANSHDLLYTSIR